MNPYQKTFEKNLISYLTTRNNPYIKYNITNYPDNGFQPHIFREHLRSNKAFQLDIKVRQSESSRLGVSASVLFRDLDCCGLVEIAKMQLTNLTSDGGNPIYNVVSLTHFWKFILWELRHNNSYGFGIWTKRIGRDGYEETEKALKGSGIRIRTNQPWTNPNTGHDLITRTLDLANFK